MRGTLTVFTFISVVLFPWPLTVMLALVSSFFVPLLPLAVGLFADTLYYAPQANAFPLYTFFGALATGAAFFVRNRLQTSSIG